MKPLKNTVVILLGPTAVGKTSLAIALARELGTEIISADSRQCFKELDIGVAKPSVAELAAVPHYFISSHSVLEEVNAAIFENYALQKTTGILAGDKPVVMAGGTGLYIRAFCEGMDAIPAVPDQIRAEIREKYNREGLAYLQDELRRKDPQFWKNGEQKNPQRLMRALEVLTATGNSITSFRKKQPVQRPFLIKKIGLELPRDLLYGQIRNRTGLMMEQGLLAEAERLWKYRELNALQTVGYKELFAYLEGKISLDQAVAEIQQNTCQYAKRQLTWFKKDPGIRWMDARQDGEKLLKEIL